MCAVGDHVLVESKKEEAKRPREPTRQEFVVKASQRARFSKTVDVGQFFRTRPICADLMQEYSRTYETMASGTHVDIGKRTK